MLSLIWPWPVPEGAVGDEDALITEMGMSYLAYSGGFCQPNTRRRANLFGLMRGLKARKVWVHCQVNARVSAFLYLYQRYELGLSDEEATGLILKALTPQMDDVGNGFCS